MKRLTLVALLLMSMSAWGSDTGIKTVVKALESKYGVHHHGIPFLWMAKPFMKGSGVSGMKIAEFENLRLTDENKIEARKSVEDSLGQEWFPFVESWEKKGDWAIIYARPAKNGMELLILSLESSEITVLQLKMDEKASDRWMDEPVQSAKNEKPH